MESRAAIRKELLDQLVRGCKTEGDLFGPKGVMRELGAALMERIFAAEMEQHLGHAQSEASANGNVRNGFSTKRVTTGEAQVEVRVPRDREGSFEPTLVKKPQRRLAGFDEKVISLYARGLSTRDIQGHLEELYGTEVSVDLISAVTDAVQDEVKAWQGRMLEKLWYILYLDCIHVKVRDSGSVRTKAVYVALGVNKDGRKEVLGLWISENEGAKFWLSVITELKGRAPVPRAVVVAVRPHHHVPVAIPVHVPSRGHRAPEVRGIPVRVRRPRRARDRPAARGAPCAPARQRPAIRACCSRARVASGSGSPIRTRSTKVFARSLGRRKVSGTSARP